MQHFIYLKITWQAALDPASSPGGGGERVRVGSFQKCICLGSGHLGTWVIAVCVSVTWFQVIFGLSCFRTQIILDSDRGGSGFRPIESETQVIDLVKFILEQQLCFRGQISS